MHFPVLLRNSILKDGFEIVQNDSDAGQERAKDEWKAKRMRSTAFGERKSLVLVLGRHVLAIRSLLRKNTQIEIANQASVYIRGCIVRKMIG